MTRNDETVGYSRNKESKKEKVEPVEDKDIKLNDEEIYKENKKTKEESIQIEIAKKDNNLKEESETKESEDSQIDYEEDKEELESDKNEEVQEESNEYEDIEEDSFEELEITCNLCGDPECARKKGDLRKTCIHYDDI